MSIKNIFSIKNIIIAVLTLVLIVVTFGIALFFIENNKKDHRF